MQLTWSLALVLVLLAVGCGRAPPRPQRGELSLHAGYYADNDHVTVANPSVRARVPLSRRVTAHAGYGLDIISAASVDVVASASRSVERRHDSTLGAQVALDPLTTVTVTGRDSREPDYRSDGVTASLDRETSARDRRLRLELRSRWDRVGPGWVLQQPADLYAGALAASVTQVVNRLTIVRVGLQVEGLSGFQSSVYRYVPVAGQWVPERVPDARGRAAATVRVQRSVRPGLAVTAEYGLTADTWGLIAHAGELGLRWEPTRALLVDFRTRVMRQSATDLYQGDYTALTAWRTRDRLLGAMSTLWPQLSVQWVWPAWPAPPTWSVGLRGTWMHQQFDDYAPLRSRDAATGEAWITRWF